MHRFRLSTLLRAGLAAVLLTPFALAQTLATGDPRPLHPPHYPLPCTVLRAQFTTGQRSAAPASDDTARLQAALTNCAGTGKSVVLLPSGSSNAFFTGPLTVSGEAVVVGYGATLFGNDSYGATSQLIYVTGNNVGIFGPGTIDGRGDLLTGKARLINVKHFQNFTAAFIQLQNPLKMHLYIEAGQEVNIFGIHIATPDHTKNTDGIDLDSLSDATVFGSFIEDGDDGVAIKTNSGPASNITVLANRFYGTHGISIGSQTMHGVSNVLFEDNELNGTDQWGNVSTDNNGINIKSDYDCGGPVNQVTYKNTLLNGVKHLLIFNTSYGSCSGTPGVPVYQDIVVDGVRAINSQTGAYSEFVGYDQNNPLQLYLAHVSLDNTTQQNSQYAIVGLDHSNITPAGPGVTTFNFHLVSPPFIW